MDLALLSPWKIEDELIEQPSWGGRYIVDLKGLTDSPEWRGKKVGQSYELANESRVINPVTKDIHRLADLIRESPQFWLGEGYSSELLAAPLLLIKLTQAKGNSFQVHLPEGEHLGHWLPKPEAWFYLGPGLYTFGLRANVDVDAFSKALLSVESEMKKISARIQSRAISVDQGRTEATAYIEARNVYQYVNVVEAHTDDIVDLTAGGIHHSWEEDNARFPDGNLVYEVQVDVQDDLCSMRGFDKGKFIDDGSIRATHVSDYLKTVRHDPEHNELDRHIKKPLVISETADSTVEAIFRTRYFNTDRISIRAGGVSRCDINMGLYHIFVLNGNVSSAGVPLAVGGSYVFPASVGTVEVTASAESRLLATYAPFDSEPK